MIKVKLKRWGTMLPFPSLSQRLKVKGLDIYIPPLTGNPDQQRFTVRSGVLSGNDTRWRSAGSGRLPNERILDPTVAARLSTDPPIPQPAELWPSTVTPQCHFPLPLPSPHLPYSHFLPHLFHFPLLFPRLRLEVSPLKMPIQL